MGVELVVQSKCEVLAGQLYPRPVEDGIVSQSAALWVTQSMLDPVLIALIALGEGRAWSEQGPRCIALCDGVKRCGLTCSVVVYGAAGGCGQHADNGAWWITPVAGWNAHETVLTQARVGAEGIVRRTLIPLAGNGAP